MINEQNSDIVREAEPSTTDPLIAIAIIYQEGEGWMAQNLQTELRSLGCAVPVVVLEKGPMAESAERRGVLPLHIEGHFWTRRTLIDTIQNWVDFHEECFRKQIPWNSKPIPNGD